jgi:2-oxoglutarate ferredoxin oxidoreductase subunit beta
VAPVGVLEYLNAATGASYTLQELTQAGERIITAGALLRLGGASADCHATQKNDYQITVMKGHSVSEVILADTEIESTWMEDPSVDIALAAGKIAA